MEAGSNLGLVWGAKAIGEVIGRTERQTFVMLDRKLIRAAKRVGGRWVADVGGLKRQFYDYQEEAA